jgi:hypothetical protein
VPVALIIGPRNAPVTGGDPTTSSSSTTTGQHSRTLRIEGPFNTYHTIIASTNPPSRKPRVATPDKKSTRAATLEEEDEDFELGSSSTPSASRKSRERTLAVGKSSKTRTIARIAPLVEDLSKECEKLRSINAEQKMDL